MKAHEIGISLTQFSFAQLWNWERANYEKLKCITQHTLVLLKEIENV